MRPKKTLPGGFLLFLVAMVLVILTVHSLTSGKDAKVSFSHQVEHLVNLDLLKRDENKQTARSETLTTFSSQFKEQQSEEGKARFGYLSLLNENHELKEAITQSNSELKGVTKDVIASADLYLHLSATPIGPQGYTVVSPDYSIGRNTGIVIKSLSPKDIVSIKEVEASLAQAKASPTNANIAQLNGQLSTLVQLFRSSKLGIGTESVKRELLETQNQITDANTQSLTNEAKLTVYTGALQRVAGVSNKLNQEKNGIRLTDLRSVRKYSEDFEKYHTSVERLENNSMQLDRARKNVADVTWLFNNKEVSTKTLEKQDSESFSHWFSAAKQEWKNFDENKGLNFQAVDQPRTLALEKNFTSQEQTQSYLSILFTLLPIAILLLLLYYVFARQMKGGGNSAMNFGKSPAKLMTKEMNKVTFKDVAGAVEAKEELEEIVDFLKDPQKFTALGAEIPKGVLLVGPPGTGKTLVAKAVAGEADRPFFSISGSDFVEMFVGVGASRIRNMFEEARKNAPCIVFIDEIDAVGRHRGSGVGGGHDEREQTLNQLLVEMDGFDSREGVILMAATNRPDVLDKALLRPGRFDRRVVLDLPDVKGRFDILKVHARKIKIDQSVELMDIAKMTPGASGADLKNILNEAALLAARQGRTAVTAAEAREAADKVRYGKERRSLEMDESEKKTTAYHESGHAIVGLVVEHGDPVDKVTIIPRGFSLGATHFMPKKNRVSYWKKEILDRLAVMMGGRVAEELFMHDVCSGAQQDISQATQLVRSMICEWGMSEELGLVSYEQQSQNGGNFYGAPTAPDKFISDETAQKIDAEVYKVLDEAYSRAKRICEENEDKLHLMANMLMEFETLDATDVKEIMDGTWNTEQKRERLKTQKGLRKVEPPPPPPKEEKGPLEDTPPEPQQA